MENTRHFNLIAGWSLTALVMVAFVWTLSGTFSAMVQIWLTSSSFNHCFLVAPASAFLIWRRRHRLAGIPPRPSVSGVVLFAGCALIWGLGALGHIATLQNLAAVAMISAAVWAVLGRRTAREIAFPLVYLFFMVPVGASLVPWLMEITADLSVILARLSGVAVYKDGLFFTIPNGSFRIVEACSGLRMLVASLAVGIFFAHLAFVSWPRRILFVVAIIVASVLANSVRAYIVVMLGHFTGMETIANHITLGYFVFGFVLVAMLIVGSRFADFDHESFARIPDASAGEAGPLWTSVATGALVVAIAVSAPAAVSAMEDRMARRPDAPPLLLPVARGEWDGPGEVRGDWSPQFRGHDTTQSGTYRLGTRAVDVFMLSYSRQAQGAELISELNRIFDPGYWTRLHESVAESEIAGGGSIRYLEMELLSGQGVKRLIRYWYVVDGQPEYRPIEIKLRELRNSAMGRPTPATLVAISARYIDDRQQAAEALDAFMQQIYMDVNLSMDAGPQ